MRPSVSLIARLLTVVCLTVIVAQAQADSEPTPEARKEASERFRRGVQLFQENAFRAALVEFERAYEIAPDYRLLYNIGQVQLQLSDYLSATYSYERYLAEGGADVPEARREDVRKALKILNERVGRVMVKTNRDGAEIFVDDQQLGVTPLAAPLVVNVGRHRVYARAPDGSVASQVIDVAGGDALNVSLKLKADGAQTVVVEEEDSPPLTKQKKIAIASWAAGGAALLGATLTGILSQGKIDDRKAELKRELPDQKKLRSLGDSASRLALTTDVLGVLALGGIATGVVLWVMDDGAGHETPQAGDIAFDMGPFGVQARGAF